MDQVKCRICGHEGAAKKNGEPRKHACRAPQTTDTCEACQQEVPLRDDGVLMEHRAARRLPSGAWAYLPRDCDGSPVSEAAPTVDTMDDTQQDDPFEDPTPTDEKGFFPAAYDDECDVCDSAIMVGDMIRRAQYGGWECANHPEPEEHTDPGPLPAALTGSQPEPDPFEDPTPPRVPSDSSGDRTYKGRYLVAHAETGERVMFKNGREKGFLRVSTCLLYTSDAADEL